MSEQSDRLGDLQFEDAFTRSGVGRQARPALMFSVRRKNGSLMAFSYSLLQRIECDPEESIRLHFHDCTLLLRGQRLEELYDQLLRHVRTEIIEFDSLHAAAFQSESVVTDVEIGQHTAL